MSAIDKAFEEYDAESKKAAQARVQERQQADLAERAFAETFDRIVTTVKPVLDEVAIGLTQRHRPAGVTNNPLRRENNGDLKEEGYPSLTLESCRLAFTVRGNPTKQRVEFVQHAWGRGDLRAQTLSTLALSDVTRDEVEERIAPFIKLVLASDPPVTFLDR